MTEGRTGRAGWRGASGSGASLCGAFEEQARRTPDAVALVHREEFLTYGQLNAEANQLAHRLAARGVGGGARVGLLTGPGPAAVCGMLAVLKAGACYEPLTAAGLAARRAGLALLLVDHGTRAAALALVADGGPAVESVDLAPDDGVARSAADPAPPGNGGPLVFGAVPVAQRALLERLAAERSVVPVRRGAVVLAGAAAQSAGSVLEWFPAWQAGGALVVPAAAGRRDAAALLALLDRQQVERWETTARVLRAVRRRQRWRGGRTLPALREVVVSVPDTAGGVRPAVRGRGEGDGPVCWVRPEGPGA